MVDYFCKQCIEMQHTHLFSVVELVVQSCPTLWPQGLYPARFLCPWDFPGKSTGGDCHFLLHGIFPTQGLNPGPLHCRQILYQLSHQRSWHLLMYCLRLLLKSDGGIVLCLDKRPLVNKDKICAIWPFTPRKSLPTQCKGSIKIGTTFLLTVNSI